MTISTTHCVISYRRVAAVIFTLFGRLNDSICDAIDTVLPNRQYLGFFSPTTPATHSPLCTPSRI